MTTLTLKHIAETTNSTVSKLMQGDRNLCYIIEDGHRDVKERGKTRIPAGTYELFPRKSGGFYGRYRARFGHDFVIGFKKVPGFKWILIHIGNTIRETDGCLLCNAEYYLASDGEYRGAGSTGTYLMLHSLFEMWFEKGPVEIVISRKPEPPAEPEDPKPDSDPVDPVTEPPVAPPAEPPLNERPGCYPSIAPRPLSLVDGGGYDSETLITNWQALAFVLAAGFIFYVAYETIF